MVIGFCSRCAKTVRLAYHYQELRKIEYRCPRCNQILSITELNSGEWPGIGGYSFQIRY